MSDHLKLRHHIEDISDFSAENLAVLISCVITRHLKKGEKILKEGDVCRSFYLVNEGYLRTYYNKDGVPINLHFTFEGGFASDLKSLKNKNGSALIIEAGEDTSVWIFDLNVLPPELKGHPEMANFVRRLAIRLLLESDEHSSLFKIYTPTERYQYIEKNNPQLLQRISLSQIASYLGVARETLSRIRSKGL